MNRQKIIYFLPIVIVLSLFFAFLFILSDDGVRKNVPPADNKKAGVIAVNPAPSATSNTNKENKDNSNIRSSSAKLPKYFVTDFNGRVAIFSDEHSPIPDEITSIRIINLPVTDQELIQNGINIDSTAELSKLLEDLGS